MGLLTCGGTQRARKGFAEEVAFQMDLEGWRSCERKEFQASSCAFLAKT